MFDEMPPGLGEFINDNGDLELAQDGILIHLLQRDNRLHVMIEVDESATQDRLRGIIPLACQWRDRVMEYQGAWRGGGDNEFLQRLHEMNEAGVSYARLAKMVNSKVEEHLREYLAYRAEIDTLYPEYKGKNIFTTELKHNCQALTHAKGLLQAMGLKDDDIDLLLREGLEQIRAGNPPFEIGYPISQRQMIDKLRNWRKSKKHKTIEEHKGD